MIPDLQGLCTVYKPFSIKEGLPIMIHFIGDMHMHTLASGHAYGTIREMAQAASEQKMEVIGITEHGPGIPGTCDPFYFCNFECEF